MKLIRALLCASVIAGLCCSCGGSSGGGSSTTPPATTPPASNTNPCANIGLTAPAPAIASLTARPSLKGQKPVADGGSQWNLFDALWRHQAARDRGGLRALGPRRATEDVGEIAVIQDEGDIIAPPNTFDLTATGIAFVRNASGGYDVRAGNAAFQQDLGTQLTLSDDDTSNVPAAFNVPYFDKTYVSAFVNSDGNITFSEGDKASTERGVGRFLTGAPRIALFFADLDPSSGGAVFANAKAGAFTVTWCNVPGFEDARKVTAQAAIAPDGTIDLRVAGTTTLTDAIVGLSPGQTNVFAPVDLTRSATGTVAGGAGAVGERFAQAEEIDLVALARKFYLGHPDNYDQILVWSDRRLITDAFAYETTVANEIRGIGVGIYDASRTFGSAGRLRSVVMMDSITKYPADPTTKFLGENNTLSLIGQEAGHRWLAFLQFRDVNGTTSNALLGRDEAHWSFFADSDASVMEGNDIEALGGGSFRTVAAVTRYSPLDQYVMGLRGEAEVPPFFYVENPVNVQPERQADSAPRVGVTFSGTRRDVLIQDVVAVMGRRQPSVADASRLHRQAFIYLVSAGKQTDPTILSKLDRIRREWESFFFAATEKRMTADTRLR
ncbi:MAG: hypothetical protein AABY89_06965 [Acidobacteriota bacterium]